MSPVPSGSTFRDFTTLSSITIEYLQTRIQSHDCTSLITPIRLQLDIYSNNINLEVTDPVVRGNGHYFIVPHYIATAELKVLIVVVNEDFLGSLEPKSSLEHSSP